MKEDADNMNLKIKSILTLLLLLVVLAAFSGCKPEQTPYQINDAENFNVSVKYDANGGIFTTNTSVIVDSYNISTMTKDGEGKVQLALITPDDPARGKDAFSPVNNGYFLAGWYTECVQSGNEVHYSGKWDFSNDLLSVDADELHSSSDPVLTLYAAWVPLFQIEFYDLSSGELLDTMSMNPLSAEPLQVPQWDKSTGTVEMYNFPKRSGHTFNGVYLDAAGKQLVTAESISHPGSVNMETASAVDPTMKLYVDWTEGEWFHIYNVEQFLDNASVSGNYVIHADLDFKDENWPTSLMHGNFAGTIEGNGYTFRNISLSQTNNSKVNSGLFGNLTENARLSDITFENVTFTIKSGTRVAGASFGLFAGTVSENASLANISILNSTLQIDSGCYFGTDDYTIGLLCGMGRTDIDYSQISCTAVGDKPENVKITVTDDEVSLEFVTA